VKEVRGEGRAVQKKGHRQRGRYPSSHHLASFRACEARGESRGCACARATAMPGSRPVLPNSSSIGACTAARSSRAACGSPERAIVRRPVRRLRGARSPGLLTHGGRTGLGSALDARARVQRCEDQSPLSSSMSGTALCRARSPMVGALSVNRGSASDRTVARRLPPRLIGLSWSPEDRTPAG